METKVRKLTHLLLTRCILTQWVKHVILLLLFWATETVPAQQEPEFIFHLFFWYNNS